VSAGETADEAPPGPQTPSVAGARVGFDNERYLTEQTAAILERVERFRSKLYLEFGGKLLFDYHAARVLPGFDPNVKMRLLQELKERADILLCIYARGKHWTSLPLRAERVPARGGQRSCSRGTFSVPLSQRLGGLRRPTAPWSSLRR